MREEMLRLSQLQARTHAANPRDTRQELEEKKKVFEDTVDRVKKQFFNYQRENACADVEKVSVLERFEQCSEFRLTQNV